MWRYADVILFLVLCLHWPTLGRTEPWQRSADHTERPECPEGGYWDSSQPPIGEFHLASGADYLLCGYRIRTDGSQTEATEFGLIDRESGGVILRYEATLSARVYQLGSKLIVDELRVYRLPPHWDYKTVVFRRAEISAFAGGSHVSYKTVFNPPSLSSATLKKARQTAAGCADRGGVKHLNVDLLLSQLFLAAAELGGDFEAAFDRCAAAVMYYPSASELATDLDTDMHILKDRSKVEQWDWHPGDRPVIDN
jgi:hypothetical protein